MRCRGHESAMRNEGQNPVAEHFTNHGTTEYTVTPIDRATNKNERLRLEEAWMILMETLKPQGLNTKY